jgi:hypothetical protein
MYENIPPTPMWGAISSNNKNPWRSHCHASPIQKKVKMNKSSSHPLSSSICKTAPLLVYSPQNNKTVTVIVTAAVAVAAAAAPVPRLILSSPTPLARLLSHVPVPLPHTLLRHETRLFGSGISFCGISFGDQICGISLWFCSHLNLKPIFCWSLCTKLVIFFPRVDFARN